MKNKKLIVETMLGNDLDFACKYLLVLYEQQTLDEQQIDQTTHKNKVGFNVPDAPVLGNISEALRHQTKLTLQDEYEILNRMPKYAGQLLKFIPEEDL